MEQVIQMDQVIHFAQLPHPGRSISEERLAGLKVAAQKMAAFFADRNSNYDSIVELPIIKICNLPVEVILKIDEMSVTVNVLRKFAEGRPDSKYREFYSTRTFALVHSSMLTTLLSALTFLKMAIPRFYLNKFEGKLTYDDFEFNGEILTDGSKKVIESAFSQEFVPSEYSNCEFAYNSCCVCLELTLSKTPCNHSLCIECEERLQFDEEVEFDMEEDDDSDDENENGKKVLHYRKCPMCRLWLGHM